MTLKLWQTRGVARGKGVQGRVVTVEALALLDGKWSVGPPVNMEAGWSESMVVNWTGECSRVPRKTLLEGAEAQDSRMLQA